MCRYVISIVLLATLVVSVVSVAEEVIGVVDWRKAVFQSKAAQKADAQMKAKNKESLDQIKVLEGKLDAMRKQLAKDRELLSDKKAVELEKEFQQHFAEYNMLRNRLQEVQLKTENQFILGQKSRIDKAMAAIAEKYKLTLVLDRQVVVYGKKTRDLTQELTDVLDSTP